jgi:uncharacterized membrane protein YdfJ with MMPL/SSD domain
MSRLALTVERHRRRILIAAGLLFAIGVGFGGPVAGKLTARSSDFQDPASEAMVAQDRLSAATNGRDGPGLVALVRTRGDVRAEAAARRKVARVAAIVAAQPEVRNVVSFASTHDRSLVSKDGHASFVAGSVKQDDAQKVVSRLRDRLSGHNVAFGGQQVVFTEIRERVKHDLTRAELLAFPILVLLSMWVFRGMIAALLPPLIGGLTIVTTFALLRLVDAHVTTLSIFALNMVTGMGLGLAIDYGLFMVSRYREELARVGPGREALGRTMSTAGRTVLFSSLTIGAAVSSLLLFPLRFLYSMAIGGVICALVAAAVSLIILPAVLAALGPRVNALAPARWQRAADREARDPHAGWWYRLSQTVMRRPAAIALAAATVMVFAGLPFLHINFGAADHRVLPTGSETRQVSDAITREFPRDPSEPFEVAISAPRSAAQEVRQYAAALSEVSRANVVGRPQPLGDSTWSILVSSRGDPQSHENRQLLDRLRDVPAPFPAAVGGATARFSDQQASLGDHLPTALALLCLTTFVLLFLMTGSVVLPLKTLLMNLLTLSAAFGMLVFVFQDGRLEGFLDYKSSGDLEATNPVLLFAIAFGLATDYGVFLLSRIKEARDSGMGERESVAFGLERTGRIVTAAALLFCVAVGAFASSSVLFIKQVGLGTAAAVAIDASIVRALLVPSLMALLGRWNWWAPRPLRWLHSRVGLSEGGPHPAAA